MIQDIFPHKLNNQFVPGVSPRRDDVILVFRESEDSLSDQVLLGNQQYSDGELCFPRYSDLSGTQKIPCSPPVDSAGFIYLFSVDNTRFFLSADTMHSELLSRLPGNDFTFADFRQLRSAAFAPQENLFAVMTAKHLRDWYRDTRFCGRCGKPMVPAGDERAMTCSCGYRAYPRIMPAVIVGVINGDRILITRYREGYRHNALVAGFTEIGETVEQTVEREIMEEVGLRVKNIRYYKSQPWGIANDILLGYFCELEGSPEIHMDHNELKYAEWIGRKELELQPNSYSLTNEMMKLFKEGEV